MGAIRREYDIPGGHLEVDAPTSPGDPWLAVYATYTTGPELRGLLASTALYPHMPRGDHDAVRDWFVDRFLADQPPAEVRVEAARQEAGILGFDLVIDHSVNMPPDRSYMAHVVPRPETVGRFVAFAPTELDAALGAVHIVHGIIEHGDAWPEP